jgi:hypothetical protein
MLISDEEILNGLWHEYGNIPTQDRLDSFKALCVMFECTDAESYDEAREKICASLAVF